MKNTLKSGRAKSLRGINYEILLRDEFNNWKESKHPVLNNLLMYLNLDFKEIELITATTKVPLLPSGGSPKTDLILTIKKSSDEILKKSISCKRSSSRVVTFHEYSALDFINILGISGQKTKNLLKKHQRDGSAKNFTIKEKEYLELKLKPLREILWEWVFLGKHHNGQGSQIVDLLITNDKVHAYEDYRKFLLNKKSGFGTGLHWTYQSKGKGKTIQLKGPVLG